MPTGICSKGSHLTFKWNMLKFWRGRHPRHAHGNWEQVEPANIKEEQAQVPEEEAPLTCSQEFVTRVACQP
jgi:hypothetical protein